LIKIDNKETEDQELWKRLPNTEGEERAELLIQLAQQAIYRSSGDEALALAEQAHQIYQSMGATASSIGMANAITGIGYSLKELKKVDEATMALNGAIDLLRDSNDPFLADTLRTKASWYGEQSNWLRALDSYIEAAQIDEIDGNMEFFARDLIAIANCYYELGNWSETITYALKAREIFKEQKLIFEISWCDLSIADAHAELQDGEQAIFWGRKANDLGVLRKDHEVICKSNYAMARGFKILEKYHDAEYLLLAAQELVAKSGDWKQINRIENELISLYRLTNRDTEADEAERRLSTLTEIVD
jgi:tetratricopeptide (TPR) repeat protein